MKKKISLSILVFIFFACKKQKENKAIYRNNLVYNLCREGISTSKDSVFYIHYLDDYIVKNDSSSFGYMYINKNSDSEKPVLDYISLFNERINSSFMIKAFIDNDSILDDLLVISPMNGLHEEDDGLRIYSKKSLFQKLDLIESKTDEITKICKNQPYNEILIEYDHFELRKSPYKKTTIYKFNQDSLKFIRI